MLVKLQFTENQKNNGIFSGSALIYALIIMTAVSVILVSLIGYINSQLKFSINRANRARAFQVAESGIYWYKWYLAHETSGKTSQEINNFWQNGTALGVSAPYEQNFLDSSNKVIGKFSISATKPAPDSTIVSVVATGWTKDSPNLKRKIKVRFRRPSWSEYAVLTNNNIRLGGGTKVYGKIHSNKGVRLDGVAYNIVSSSVPSYDDPDHSGNKEFGVHTHVDVPPATGVNESFRPLEAPPNPVQARTDVFKAGREFPVKEIDFNGVLSDLSYMKTQAKNPAHGLYFNDNGYGRHIILKTDGTMSVSLVTNYDKDTYDSCGRIAHVGTGRIISEKDTTNYTIPNGGIVFVENNAWVEGKIDKKKVTIVAANLIGGQKANIYVGMHNLTYTNFDGQDIIGLIAQKNVEALRDSQNFLTIDGALIAQSGRVGRKFYSCRDYRSYFFCWIYRCVNYSLDSKNTITLNGSLATDLRYGFAWGYPNGTFAGGYQYRTLNFDNNLLYSPPPYFPTGSEYSIDKWTTAQ